MVLDLAENSVIADAVSPQSGQFGPETFAETVRIGVAGNPLVEVS